MGNRHTSWHSRRTRLAAAWSWGMDSLRYDSHRGGYRRL